jgi:WD40 repeat protein
MVWETHTGRLVKELPPEGETEFVTFSPDGRHLVTSGSSDFRFWQVGSWALTRRIPKPSGNDFSPGLAFSPDGKVFAGTHSSTAIRLYDAATGEKLADLEAPEPRLVTGLVFNGGGTQLAACDSVAAARVWDLKRLRQQLAELHLDWGQPPYPKEATGAVVPGPNLVPTPAR